MDTLHPILKRMSTSPYTWEYMIRMHEGTKGARGEYKKEKDAQKDLQIFHPEFEKERGMQGLSNAYKAALGAIISEQQGDALKSATDKKWWFWGDGKRRTYFMCTLLPLRILTSSSLAARSKMATT